MQLFTAGVQDVSSVNATISPSVMTSLLFSVLLIWQRFCTV